MVKTQSFNLHIMGDKLKDEWLYTVQGYKEEFIIIII